MQTFHLLKLSTISIKAYFAIYNYQLTWIFLMFPFTKIASANLLCGDFFL